MLGLGEKLFPELENMFITNPDKTITELPTLAELRSKWSLIVATLTEHFEKMSAADWLSKHTKVSEEDFAKDVLRNKLNVLIGRTNHQSYHLGQLALLTDKD